MGLSADEVSFLDDHHSAAMITAGADGTAKAVRVGVALVDGKLWSSGTSGRVRTRRLRESPQCTLFVFDSAYAWLTMETMVSILDGPDAPVQNLRLFRQMQGKPLGPLQWFGGNLEEDQFLRTMSDEGRLIYEFDVHRSYGLH
jgi:hypothetical protein